MFASKSLLFTLFFAISFLFASSSADANANNGLVHRRAALASRMVKVRQLPGLGGAGDGAVAGVGSDPNETGTSTTDTSTATSTTATSTASAATSSTTSKATSAATSSTTSTTSSSSTSTTSSTSSSSSSTSTSSSSTSTTSSSSTSTSARQQQTNLANGLTSTLPDASLTLTVTGSSSAESQTATSADTNSASSTSSVTKTTVTVIIVIASCIGGAVIIWTVIRKWKFRPSAQFEDRMQPIDWQPTMDTNDDPIPGHRRRGSGSSFNSGSDHHGMQQTSVSNHGGALVADLPSHDFTAGATGLAPMGGYADLARGPSPQPQMNELARGPSMNRAYPAYPQAPSYDNYGPRF